VQVRHDPMTNQRTPLLRPALRPVWRGVKPAVLRLTGWARRKPGFIIIGEAKCGTFALHYYLGQHPRVGLPVTKEPNFFNNHYADGWWWYRSLFPWRWQAPCTGEASADYFFHPRSAPRIARDLPGARLIVMLRNPVKRVLSHYKHNRTAKSWVKDPARSISEPLSLEEALEAEKDRLTGEREKLLADGNYYSWNHEHFSYKARGCYIEQIEYWLQYFDREQFLFIRSEDLRKDKRKVFERTCDFLGLERQALTDDRDYHVTGSDEAMSEETLESLRAYFAPYNERLYAFLGEDWGW